YGSTNPADSSIILFSSSADGAATWSDPVRISKKAGDCLDSDNTDEGAVPAVGPGDEVYVAWAGPEGIVFDKSTDNGKTWLKENIHVSDIPGGWDFSVRGIFRCNGLPVINCDTSHSKYFGNIYISWSDQRNGDDDTDIWLTGSSDGGTTWTEPLRVNCDETSSQQFFSSMTIDQATGKLYIVFYDRRNYPDEMTDVYLAVSEDGGRSFFDFRISSDSFRASSDSFIGDYIGLTAYNGIIRPVWVRLDGNEQSLWTALVNEKLIDKLRNGSK
ncbi:MAG: sialidase family protein, partial [Bacteroidia bacterium]|nr:sialidase family protein [Bacteroidia bacterium]